MLLGWRLHVDGREIPRDAWPVRGGRSRVISSSRSGLVVNPALSSGRVLWVEQFGQTSYLRLRRVRGGPVRTLATLLGPDAGAQGAPGTTPAKNNAIMIKVAMMLNAATRTIRRRTMK